MSLNIELLEQSFEKIKPRADEFAASFYEHLFTGHPELKPLFATTDMAKQQKKLLNALVLVVENLRNPEALEPVLNAMGKRHIGYGATAKYYGPVGEALLMSFEQYLQQDWTPEVKQAWVDAYRAITALMLKGAGAESVPKEAQLESKIPPKQAEYQLQSIPEKEPQELPVELLESSFKKIKPRADEFAASFYEHLFTGHPELKPLFATTDMAKQQKKLLNALVLVVENLRNPEALEPVLNAMGKRHIGYGATAKYYGPVGEALLMSFEQYLQQDWTPEVKQAWVDAYRAITALMLKGASAEYPPKVISDQKAAAEEKPSKLKESKPFQPEVEQQKKPLISMQWNGEILPKITAKISDKYQQFQPKFSVGQWGEILKQIPLKAIEAFWISPAWLVATVSAIIFTIFFVSIDENSLLGKALGAADTISLVVALVLVIKEAPDRRKQFHYQAWSIIDAAHGVKVSYARILALQDLNEDNVSLRGLDATGAELIDINLPKANLSAANFNESDLSNANLSNTNLDNANLSGAKVSGANLSHANLSFARLNKANLSSANLSSANLICADLSNANMSGVNLRNATLNGANLDGAYLTGANLKGAKVSISELSAAFIEGAIMPDGSKHQSQKASK
ncbi:globin domain protein [Tolypothrix sp. NIES-4075]|uniref:globin domain-containing protein n=1 Tax=Tolypothrix sp. NIES-4075 TaxID=2005459 RepID=UPI000B5CA3B4|nr:globin domain-containing protein [Tolypothrix sp. NIES-4075]GAX40706.1 globin domain protein [Tolypothrix sp. NIES-4075]